MYSSNSAEVLPIYAESAVAEFSVQTGAFDKIFKSFSEFETHLLRAEVYEKEGNFAAAALSVAVAAGVAANRHCGLFASPRLERVLISIGRKLSDRHGKQDNFPRKTNFENILHVSTQLAPVGGLTRMISRWISADAKRKNSLLLTQHRGSVPEHLTSAVRKSGGKIHHLNYRVGGKLEWALELRRVARDYDAIILHIHCEDVIPLIAFAEPDRSPPVLFLNHADHLFWLGPSISHLTINLRDAAQDISIGRRGIEERRNILLPTIVDPTVRKQSRLDAKRALKIDPDRVVLLSVARGVKYRTMNGVSYADIHAPLLAKFPNATLVVVGVGDPRDWDKARAETGGRIISLPEISDPSEYFEAADIYVDSYPFVSSTSMMEAAGYGLPLATLFTGTPDARIFGINHVGLVGTALVATSFNEYRDILSQLISDVRFRESAGNSARLAIEQMHTPPGWLAFLEAVYERAAQLPPLAPRIVALDSASEKPYLGEPDCRHQDIVGSCFDAAEITKGYMGMVPVRHRLALWQEMRRKGAFHSPREAIRHLFPEWLVRVVKDKYK